jgi:hypothetical protein
MGHTGIAVADSGVQTATFDNVSVTTGTTPYISGVSPSTAGAGTSVTISGSHFGALQGASWGSWSDVAIRCAAIRVLKKTRTTKLNAFEVTGIHARRFLGVPYVVVTGHSRHLQKSTVLQSIAERIHQATRPEPTLISDGVSVAPVPAPAIAK